MTFYDDRPERILMSNRTRVPSAEEITAQINALARMLINLAEANNRILSLENQILSLQVKPISLKVVRSLDTDFVVHSTRSALVLYTIELTASRVLTGTDSVQADLVVDGLSQSDLKNLLSVTLALGVGITSTHQKVLIGFILPNSTVNLTTSGTGTASIIQSLEVLL